MGCAASTAATSALQPQQTAASVPVPAPKAEALAPSSAGAQPASTVEQATALVQGVAMCSIEVAGEQAQEMVSEVAARAGSIKGIGDVKGILKGNVEERIDEVAQLRDRWMTGIGESADDFTGDVDFVLDGVEKLVGMSRNDRHKEQPVDIQSLELRKRSKLEQGFAKYSALGQVGGSAGTCSTVGAWLLAH